MAVQLFLRMGRSTATPQRKTLACCAPSKPFRMRGTLPGSCAIVDVAHQCATATLGTTYRAPTKPYETSYFQLIARK